MNNGESHIGVDVSKGRLDIDAPVLGAFSVPNTGAGIRCLLGRLGVLKNPLLCCEATGGYERLLVERAIAVGVPIAVVNAAWVRFFARSNGTLAKTDAIDARALRRFGEQNRPRPLAPPPEWAGPLRQLLDRRSDLVDLRGGEACREGLAGGVALRFLKAHLRFIDRQIRSIDRALEALALRHPVLGERSARLRRVNSIGPVSALTLLGFLPELGRITDNQAAALAGLAPYNNDSGTSGGPRAIRGGRARIRKTLYMAAVCATRSNPILREFYARLVEHGKPAKVALTAVMRKLVVLANRILANPEFNPS